MEPTSEKLLLFLQCPTHFSSSLGLVCIDSTCTKQGLICSECKNKDHIHHSTIALREFVKRTKQKGLHTSESHPILERIDDLKTSSNKSFDDTKAIIIAALEGVQNHVNELVDRLKKDVIEKIKQDQENHGRLQVFDYKITEDYNKIMEDVRQAVKNMKSLEADKYEVIYEVQLYEQAHKKRQKILQDLKYELNRSVKQMSRISTSDSFSVEDLQPVSRSNRQEKSNRSNIRSQPRSHHKNQQKPDVQEFIPPSTSRQRQKQRQREKADKIIDVIAWSNKLKHPSILVEHKKIARSTCKDKLKSVGIMANRVVNVAPPYIYQWYVKIVKQTSVIDVGICIEDIVKQNDFLYGNWTLNGHGNFTMSSEGRCYSSIDNTLYKTSNNLAFTTRDKIRIQYFINENRLRFTKISPSGYEQSAQFRVQRLSKYQHFRPCVYFIGDDNCVQLSEEAD